VLKDGRIFAFGSSFVHPSKSESVTLVQRSSHKERIEAFESNIASPRASIQVTTAIAAAERAFPGAYNGYPTKLEYYAQPDGSVVLVHVIQIQGDNTWFQVYIDAHSGQVVSSSNFRSDFQQPGVRSVSFEFDEPHGRLYI